MGVDREPWFGPKRYGYGVGARSWKGVAVTLAFVALMVGLSQLLPPHGPAMTAAGMGAATVAFLALVAAKSAPGRWRWRWGDRER